VDAGTECGDEPCLRSAAFPGPGFSISILKLWQPSAIKYNESADGTSISFDVKVSSQPIGDKLTFKIGGTFTQDWSGEVGWQRVTHELPVIRPTFVEWEYRKNGDAINDGSDAAWIRRVVVE